MSLGEIEMWEEEPLERYNTEKSESCKEQLPNFGIFEIYNDYTRMLKHFNDPKWEQPLTKVPCMQWSETVPFQLPTIEPWTVLPKVGETRPLLEVVAHLEFCDLWPDAQLERKKKYLRGIKSLLIILAFSAPNIVASSWDNNLYLGFEKMVETSERKFPSNRRKYLSH